MTITNTSSPVAAHTSREIGRDEMSRVQGGSDAFLAFESDEDQTSDTALHRPVRITKVIDKATPMFF